MSFAATYNAFQVSGITKAEQHVLTAICTFADKNGVCWPSVETIANRCLSSVRTVQVHISALVAKGLLQRIYRKGRSAITKVLVPTPAESAPLPPQILHPEPVTEPINTITAAPAVEPAATPPSLFSEIPEQPKTAVEPSHGIGGTIASPEPVQSTVGQSDALMPETMANEPPTPSTAEADPLAEVPAQLLQDLGEVRRNKKKPAKVTKTEADMWYSEALKAGWTMQQVIVTMILRGWSRFEASWVEHVPQQVAPGQTKVWEPEPHTPASPEAVAAAKARIAQMKERWAAENLRQAAPPLRR